jgi:hypothetical protein
MLDGMTRIATYTSEIEAEIAKSRLEALGVVVVLTKDNCGGMRPHLDLQQGVKLFVPDQESDKAREILQDSSLATAAADWICPDCATDIPGNFETCWNCGRDRE